MYIRRETGKIMSHDIKHIINIEVLCKIESPEKDSHVFRKDT